MKLVIVSQQRQGSTLLRLLMESHSMVHTDPEIFHHNIIIRTFPKWLISWIDKYPRWYLKYHELKSDKPVYCFKFMVNQLSHPRSFIHQLFRSGYKVISIRRRDAIGIAFSRCISEQTNKWLNFNNEHLRNEKVVIDTAVFFDALKKVEDYYKLQDKVLSGIDHLLINYEDDLCKNDQFQHFSTVFSEYTGLPFELLTTNLLVTDERKDSERIQNFNEIMEAIKASPFAHYLAHYIGDRD